MTTWDVDFLQIRAYRFGGMPILMGCLVGGAGSPFSTGYNAYMESKFPMLEPVLTLGVLGRS